MLFSLMMMFGCIPAELDDTRFGSGYADVHAQAGEGGKGPASSVSPASYSSNEDSEQQGYSDAEGSGADCAGGLSHADEEELLKLSDRGTLQDIYDVEYRVERVAELFSRCDDPRGLFAVVYSPITAAAVDAIDGGVFEHEGWTRSLILDFAGRYFDNLRRELLGQETSWAWERYYDLAAMDDVSWLRTASMGIVVHLVVDLPWTLVEIDTQEHHKEDFMVFGEVLVEETEVIIDDLWTRYEVDAEDFFNGFFLGDWVNGVFGDSAMTTFAFQTIRTKAWNNAWTLQQWWGGWVAESEIYVSYWTMDGILAGLDAAGTI